MIVDESGMAAEDNPGLWTLGDDATPGLSVLRLSLFPSIVMLYGILAGNGAASTETLQNRWVQRGDNHEDHDGFTPSRRSMHKRRLERPRVLHLAGLLVGISASSCTP